ncbi:hypothetical protein TNIN_250771 [Trichonephila inaurata madagascariensis]|uniref:Uncharacterized protein n=1 Tax=Trichonephila inaurata madagascariensis TaxID=2747483 RepID=A0A8X6XXS0_9ARAC|nr:hypothetical protein TNIN_219111 [Trichonephila inaurata madagascariensis]GFY61281.1 hypothetical protein TNIN_250771 [Trichonephila inaurata madagascariensis]
MQIGSHNLLDGWQSIRVKRLRRNNIRIQQANFSVSSELVVVSATAKKRYLGEDSISISQLSRSVKKEKNLAEKAVLLISMSRVL